MTDEAKPQMSLEASRTLSLDRIARALERIAERWDGQPPALPAARLVQQSLTFAKPELIPWEKFGRNEMAIMLTEHKCPSVQDLSPRLAVSANSVETALDKGWTNKMRVILRNINPEVFTREGVWLHKQLPTPEQARVMREKAGYQPVLAHKP